MVMFFSSDPHSGIASVSVCLGRTRYDCSEMDWYQHVGNDPFVNQAFKLSDGVRTWVRLRAINNGKSLMFQLSSEKRRHVQGMGAPSHPLSQVKKTSHFTPKI